MNSLGLMTELNTNPTAAGKETEATAAVEGSEVLQGRRERERERERQTQARHSISAHELWAVHAAAHKFFLGSAQGRVASASMCVCMYMYVCMDVLALFCSQTESYFPSLSLLHSSDTFP